MTNREKINIVMPMAGKGQRFLDQGIKTPKPLIKIGEKTIVELIIKTLGFDGAQFIFIVRDEQVRKHAIDKALKDIIPNSEIIILDQITEGALCTVLYARDYINSNAEMVIKDCDQIINWSAENFLEYVRRRNADGAVVTIATQNPGFSYAKLDVNCQHVVETREKRVVSMFGNTGLYYFAKGSEFLKYADQMIAKNIRVNNEFYVSPIYNEYIEDAKLILNYPIAEMFSFNTPEELEKNSKPALQFLRQFDPSEK